MSTKWGQERGCKVNIPSSISNEVVRPNWAYVVKSGLVRSRSCVCRRGGLPVKMRSRLLDIETMKRRSPTIPIQNHIIFVPTFSVVSEKREIPTPSSWNREGKKELS